jgi:hypothetical protein
MERVIAQKIVRAILSALVTFAAGFALKRTWRLVTGAEPPDPEDLAVPTRRAVTWFIASGVGIGVVQLLFARTMAKSHALSTRPTSDEG